MEEPIFVSLESVRVQDGDKIKPIKTLDEKILDGTFRELIDTMVDTDASDIEGRHYNLAEIEYINQIKASYSRAINNPNGIVLLYARKNANEENSETNGPYDINSRPADYIEEIMEISEIEENGVIIPYRHMDLLIKEDLRAYKEIKENINLYLPKIRRKSEQIYNAAKQRHHWKPESLKSLSPTDNESRLKEEIKNYRTFPFLDLRLIAESYSLNYIILTTMLESEKRRMKRENRA